MLRKRGERQWRDELLSSRRHNHLHLGTFLDQQTYERGTLVGGYPASDPYNYMLVL